MAQPVTSTKSPAGREAVTAAEVQALNVEADCTAEMSLSMIRGRVLEASYRLDGVPTDQQIQDESDRILLSFEPNWTGQREYDVAPDGQVRDWRRPETTPDAGPIDATVTVITDETMQQSSLFLVPSDSAFNGRLYYGAPELANIAERLIAQHGFLSALVNCEIMYFWKRKTGVSKGRVKIGWCKRASDLLGHFSGADFIIWLSATTARDGKFTDRQVEAALFHQLLHIGTDDEGNFIFAPHDFEGFAAEVTQYGTWTSDLRLGGAAFVAAKQMGLFDDGADDDDDPLADDDV